jgi:hypothetical protein
VWEPDRLWAALTAEPAGLESDDREFLLASAARAQAARSRDRRRLVGATAVLTVL